jgi:hypothetical protein
MRVLFEIQKSNPESEFSMRTTKTRKIIEHTPLNTSLRETKTKPRREKKGVFKIRRIVSFSSFIESSTHTHTHTHMVRFDEIAL